MTPPEGWEKWNEWWSKYVQIRDDLTIAAGEKARLLAVMNEQRDMDRLREVARDSYGIAGRMETMPYRQSEICIIPDLIDAAVDLIDVNNASQELIDAASEFLFKLFKTHTV